MHEYSVVAELISSLIPQLDGHDGVVRAVILKKGGLRILSDRALMAAYEILARGTRLEGSQLEIEAVSVRIACRACDYEGEAEHFEDEGAHFSVPVLSCPQCQGKVDVVAGRELCVDRVRVAIPDVGNGEHDGG